MTTSAQSEMNRLLPTLTARAVIWLVGTVRCVEAAISLGASLVVAGRRGGLRFRFSNRQLCSFIDLRMVGEVWPRRRKL